MKKTKLFVFFAIAATAGLLIRIFQLIAMIDGATGFLVPAYEGVGAVLTGILLALGAALAGFTFFFSGLPARSPKPSRLTAVPAALLGIVLLSSVFTEAFAMQVPSWQIFLMKLLGLAAGLFFLTYAAGPFFGFTVAPAFLVIPIAFWIIRTVCLFTTIASLAMITDNIFAILTSCLVLVFFLELTELANGYHPEKAAKKMLFAGLPGAFFCLLSTLPRFLVSVVDPEIRLHETSGSMIVVLLSGVFMATTILSVLPAERSRRTV